MTRADHTSFWAMLVLLLATLFYLPMARTMKCDCGKVCHCQVCRCK